jgi:hypothetical protein
MRPDLVLDDFTDNRNISFNAMFFESSDACISRPHLWQKRTLSIFTTHWDVLLFLFLPPSETSRVSSNMVGKEGKKGKESRKEHEVPSK